MSAADRVELRDMEIYEARIRGAKLDELAEKYDLSPSRISNICAEVRRGMPELSRESLVAASLDQLEFLREKVIELMNLTGAPVTVGQEGYVLRDPESGEVVRDYSLRLKAVNEAHRLNQTFAKRLGLDAPTVSEVKASVQYEVVGLDPEALT